MVPNRRNAVLATAMLALGPFAVAGAPETVPLELSLQVVWGEIAHGETLRATFERELERALQAEGCYASIRVAALETDPDAPPPDLVYQVTLETYEERAEHETSIAQQTAPNAVPHETATRQVARIETTIVGALYAGGGEELVFARRFHEAQSYRPRLFEDPMVEARWRLVDDVTRVATEIACGKGRKKVLRRLAQRGPAD